MSSSKPRAAWVMVPAAFAEQTTDALADLMEPGDVVIDGGNSYRDDVDRAERYAEKGVHFADVGTSGGVFGLERGFCLMIGGEDEVAAARPDLQGRSRPAWTRRRARRAARTRTPRPQNRDTHCGPPGGALREDGPQRDSSTGSWPPTPKA